MGNKGGKNKLKRIATPKIVKGVGKKSAKFGIKPSPGAHGKEKCIPITNLLRDLLGIASNLREVRQLLSGKEVLIDGKAVSDPKFPVGFMDILTFPRIKKSYRILFDKLGRLDPVETSASEASFKLCRVKGKRMIDKGRIQLSFHDGRTQISKDRKIAVGDTIKMQIPEQKVLEVLKLKEGAVAYIYGGSNAGQIGKISKIQKGSITRKPVISLEKGIETIRDYVFVVGENKPIIRI